MEMLLDSLSLIQVKTFAILLDMLNHLTSSSTINYGIGLVERIGGAQKQHSANYEKSEFLYLK